MHELSVLVEIVNRVEQVAREQELSNIETLVLQIGELSSMVPSYMQDLYPAAIEGTVLENSKLEIEIIPGNGSCLNCNHVYRLLDTDGVCPKCGKKNFDLLSGKEFYIKEIQGY